MRRRRKKRRKRRGRKRGKKKRRGPVRERSAKEAVHVAEIPANHQTDESAILVSIRGPGVGRGREAGMLRRPPSLLEGGGSHHLFLFFLV